MDSGKTTIVPPIRTTVNGCQSSWYATFYIQFRSASGDWPNPEWAEFYPGHASLLRKPKASQCAAQSLNSALYAMLNISLGPQRMKAHYTALCLQRMGDKGHFSWRWCRKDRVAAFVVQEPWACSSGPKFGAQSHSIWLHDHQLSEPHWSWSCSQVRSR